MKNLNLLQIVPSLESGGVEQGTIDVANFIAKNDISSYIVSNGGNLLKLLNHQKVFHFQLPVHSKNFLKMPYVARQLNNIILENNINIVHVRSRAPSWLLQFIRNKKFISVSSFHNVYGTNNIIKIMYNKGLTKVNYIIAISNFVKSQIIKKYNINDEKITVINRGIDTNFFNPERIDENEFASFLLKYDIPNDKKIILYPGRLTNWKGQINFLQILESYKNENIICYFVGDDKNISYSSKLIKEINQRKLMHICRILGNLSRENIRNIYKCADLVVSAPLSPEGFGRTIGESLAMKKIILSYDYGGARDQLTGLSDIYKVKPNDNLQMRKKIDQVLNLPREYINNLGSVSRKHVMEKFSLETMLLQYLSFYKKILL